MHGNFKFLTFWRPKVGGVTYTWVRLMIGNLWYIPTYTMVIALSVLRIEQAHAARLKIASVKSDTSQQPCALTPNEELSLLSALPSTNLQMFE